MTSRESQILANLKKALLGNRNRFPVMAAKVVTVDAGTQTCTVNLSITDVGVELPGVMLNALAGNDLGVVLYPAINSIVWVAELDGPGKYGVVRCSEVTKVGVKVGDVTGEVSNGKVYWKQGDGELTLQGGKLQWKNGGGDLKTGFDTFFTHMLAMTVPTGVGPSGPPINSADFTSDQSYFDGLLF